MQVASQPTVATTNGQMNEDNRKMQILCPRLVTLNYTGHIQ